MGEENCIGAKSSEPLCPLRLQVRLELPTPFRRRIEGGSDDEEDFQRDHDGPRMVETGEGIGELGLFPTR